MTFLISGRVRRFGDDINTDYVVSSSRKKESIAPEFLKNFLFETIDPDFAASVEQGDIIVAGKNFGCGSAMEVAVTALLGAGIRVVLAQSFARTYFRNAINNGLFPIVCDTSEFREGDRIAATGDAGRIEVRNLRNGRVVEASPYPPIILQILDEGGLVPFLKERGRFSTVRSNQGVT